MWICENSSSHMQQFAFFYLLLRTWGKSYHTNFRWTDELVDLLALEQWTSTDTVRIWSYKELCCHSMWSATRRRFSPVLFIPFILELTVAQWNVVQWVLLLSGTDSRMLLGFKHLEGIWIKAIYAALYINTFHVESVTCWYLISKLSNILNWKLQQVPNSISHN